MDYSSILEKVIAMSILMGSMCIIMLMITTTNAAMYTDYEISVSSCNNISSTSEDDYTCTRGDAAFANIMWNMTSLCVSVMICDNITSASGQVPMPGDDCQNLSVIFESGVIITSSNMHFTLC